MKLKLSKYIAQIDQKFEQTRRTYEKLQKEMNIAADVHGERMKMLNPLGQNKELERYQEEQKKLQISYEKNKADFDTYYAEVREEVRKTFRSLFALDGGEVDAGMLSVLQAHILSDAELIELGKHYIESGNLTMLRLVGKFADERADALPEKTQFWKDMQYLRTAGKEAGRRTDLELIDTQKKICDLALRDDRNLADGTYMRVYVVEDYLKAGEAYTVEVKSPFDDE